MLTRTPIEWRDPLAAFEPLKDSPFALLLHGAGGRWSYICADPLETLVSRAGEGDALAVMARRSDELDFRRPDDAPPFCGGWAGLIAYEFGRVLLPKLEAGPDRGDWADLAFGLYDQAAVFDNERKSAEIWRWNWGGGVRDTLADRLGAASPRNWRGALSDAAPAPRETPEAYAAKIARTVRYVHAGDCFQANISQAFDFRLAEGAHPFDLTIRLDRSSQAPFSAYFRLPDGLALASNSPERFLHVRRDEAERLTVATKPIKGTRARGSTPEEDERLARELLASEKDQAENLMIVDLMRNDLAKVSDPGTVTVPKLNALESFANVHHLVSTVEAVLSPGKTAFDLIRAAFPGGSVTGAPKVRAMQIIAELEDAARGPYCGSLAWIAPDGLMDSSILIRSTAFRLENDRWRGEFRVGGGVVADSDPASEYQETLDKGAALVRALGWPAAKDGETI